MGTKRSEATLTAAWDIRGIDVGELETDVTRRLVTVVSDMPSSAPAPLPSLAGDTGTSTGLFSMGETIGEGGMGRVRLAWQAGLEREVAVKTPREGASETVTAQLIREARVTGALEHPNITPVHALGTDSAGRPLIVMKRIEGTAWNELLAAEEERNSLPYLRRHLRILIQVASAAHFAHTRGIVHRDIKPSNVMAGEQNEVYLVDWGIAARHRDHEGFAGVPRVADISAVEGTPAYMAPEMAEACGESIGPRTDVYLLGATLYEVVTGSVPHDGSTLIEVLKRAYSRVPEFDQTVPRDLASICRRALALEPRDRFDSAAEVAEALEDFLMHRASGELAERAERDLQELQRLTGTMPDDDLGDLYLRFAQCRFAFAHALRDWPENDGARRGLQNTLRLMARVELARGSPEAAQLLLRDLPAPDAELSREVDAAVGRRKRDGAKLERIQHDVDLRVGSGFRAGLAAGLGGLYGLAMLVFLALMRSGTYQADALDIAYLNGAMLLFVLVAEAARRRRRVPFNVVSQRLALGICLHFVAHITWLLIAHMHLEMPLAQTILIKGFGDSLAFVAASVFVDRSVIALALASVLGVMAILLFPSHYLLLYGIACIIGSLESARVMSKGPAPLDYDPVSERRSR